MAAYDPTKWLQGLGRRDPGTGMLHGHVRWPSGSQPTPNGCRWCGWARGGHERMWLPGRGLHGWEQPTQAQILARMRARRNAFKSVCRCRMPHEQQPLAPVVDPYRCEADDCRMHDYLLGLWLRPLSASEAARTLTAHTTTTTTRGTR